jgi:NTE family protein
MTEAADVVIGTSAADLQRAMGAFGLESDSTLGLGAGQQRRAMVAARLPRPEWPDRPMIVVAVDAHTGELLIRDGLALLPVAALAPDRTPPSSVVPGLTHGDPELRSDPPAKLCDAHDLERCLSAPG